jgi:hypothetical protein
MKHPTFTAFIPENHSIYFDTRQSPDMKGGGKPYPLAMRQLKAE